MPSKSPTNTPSIAPSVSPTNTPSVSPTKTPSSSPTKNPTKQPSIAPSVAPSNQPTKSPIIRHQSPTSTPTNQPQAPPVQSQFQVFVILIQQQTAGGQCYDILDYLIKMLNSSTNTGTMTTYLQALSYALTGNNNNNIFRAVE